MFDILLAVPVFCSSAVFLKLTNGTPTSLQQQ
jgi:hypothetical protein